jgi:hypothetical protein
MRKEGEDWRKRRVRGRREIGSTPPRFVHKEVRDMVFTIFSKKTQKVSVVSGKL